MLVTLLGIVTLVVACVRNYFLHPVHRAGEMSLAILGQSLAELKPGQVTTVLARCDGGVGPRVGRVQVRAGIGQDQAILGHPLGSVRVARPGEAREFLRTMKPVALKITALYKQGGE